MKVWFKRVLISVVVLVIVALVGAAIFLLTFDPNAYKSKLEDIVYQRYQRTLTIEGNIELSLFPRIGLAVQGVSLSDRDSDSTFASIDSARFAVAIWPLLSNRLVVDHVSVSGFKAWVARDEEGDLNFRDLVNGPPAVSGAKAPFMLGAAAIRSASDAQAGAQEDAPRADAAQSGAREKMPASVARYLPAGTDFQIDIAGLDLKNGEIHMFDKSSGMEAHVVQLDLNTGRMTFDQAFTVALKGKLEGGNPLADADIDAQAVLKLNPERRSYVAQKLNVQVVGEIADFQTKTLSLKGNLAYDAYLRLFNASSLEVVAQGERVGDEPIKGIDISLLVPKLKVDRSAAELQVEKLAYRARADANGQRMELQLDAPRLSVSPAAASGEPIVATFKTEEPGKTVGVNVGMSGLAGDAWKLAFKELKMEGVLKQGNRVVQLNAVSPAQWDVLDERGTLSALKGDVKIEDVALPDGGVEFPLIGSARLDLIKDELTSDINAVLQGSKLVFGLKAQHLKQPRIVFSLDADKLDLDALFPPAAGLRPAGESGKSAEQPQDKSEPKPPAAPEAGRLDWAFLDNLDITGAIKSDELKFQNLIASDFDVDLIVKNGKLSLNDAKATMYDGSMSGRFSVDKENKMAAALVLKGISLGPVLHDVGLGPRLSGTATVDVKLASQGVTRSALTAALDGSARLQIKDGSVRGLDVEKTLEEINQAVGNVFSGQAPDLKTVFDDSRQTAFSSLETNVALTQGQAAIETLSVQAPSLRVTQGDNSYLDLVNGQADVGLRVRLAKAPKGRESAVADVVGLTVPLRISGPFGQLRYQVQWNDIASEAVKSAVRQGLLDLLNDAGVVEAITEPVAEDAPKRDNGGSASAGNRLGDAIRALIDKDK